MRQQQKKLLIAGALVALILVLLFVPGWGFLKGPIERRVEAQTGRAFSMERFRMRVCCPLRVYVQGLKFANPDWAVQPQMLELADAEARLALLHLWRGELFFPEVRVVQPTIDLELGSEDRRNWVLTRDTKEGGRKAAVGHLTVDRGVLTFHDPAKKTAIKVEVATTAAAQEGGAEGVKFGVTGDYQALKVKAEGTGGTLLSLQDTTTPYPLKGTFSVGPTSGSVDGTITGLVSLAAMDVNLTVKGESLDELYKVIRVALPPTPPYNIKGHLLHEDVNWQFHDFVGRVGDSDLSGDFDVAYRNKRANVKATLVSQKLDLDDLGGFIGAPPQARGNETASPKQEAEAAQARASPKLFPDKPFKTERLNAMDADIKFTGKSIRNKRLPIDDLKFHAKLDHGKLDVDPLNFGLAGGEVFASLAAETRKEALAVSSDFHFKRISLPKLFPTSQIMQESTGLIGGRAKLKGRGNSFADIVGHSDGTMGLAMRGGKVSNLLMEFVGLDAAEILKFLFTGDRNIQLRCAVADMDLKDGVLHSKSIVFDTTDTNIAVEGTVSLRDESLDVTLHPHPKDWSPVSLRSPIKVAGTFKNRKIRPEKEMLVKGGIAAVLAALVAPLAALIPLIETGKGEDADCAGLIAAVEQHAKTKAP